MRMYLKDSKVPAVEMSYPIQDNNKEESISEISGSWESSFGKAFCKGYYFDDIIIGFGNYTIFDHTFFRIESNWEVIKMYFVLNGHISITDYTSGKRFSFGANRHNIIYSHSLEGSCEWSKNTNMQIFEIAFTPSFFNKYLQDHLAFDIFRKQISVNANAQISQHNQIVTPKMTWVIGEILKTDCTSPYKRMFIEAKIIELLMLQFEQIADNKANNTSSLNRKEIDQMHAVKEIILNNINATFSLMNLAREVGTNEFKLKKGFKEVFGTTVFGFWQQMKMEEAKKLLLDTNLTISEISDEVGYKNARHFSRAFKKYYGKSPSYLTKDKNKISGF
ncbi:MAG: AraC family transcriptional regulator [Bacteroidota bacterium]